MRSLCFIMLTKGGGVTVNELTARQKKFAEYYVQSGNTVQSAIKAGYSEAYANSRAYEMLENVGVSEYIKSLSDRLTEERIIDAKDRQVILSEIATDKKQVPSDRIRAIDTLNKMTGEYLNKVEVSGTLATETSKLDELIRQMKGDE